MKVLLINPTTKLAEENRWLNAFINPILPLGIASIAAVLEREGIDAKIIDQFACRMSKNILLTKVKEYCPDIIGFSCITPNMQYVKEIVQELRKFSNAKIVLGNIHPTLFSEELLKDKIVDIVVRGEGEDAMRELTHAVKNRSSLRNIKGISYRENNSIFCNPDRPLIEDLDSLPYPAWHLFDLSYYREVFQASIHNETLLVISGSRGCPYRCVYCCQDKIYPKMRQRKCDEIIKELEYMHTRYQMRYFGFIDANFPFSIDFGMRFCKELIRSGLHKKIRWCVETRVDLLNEDLLIMMKKAGVHSISLGFESGNQNVLDSINKRISLEQGRNVMKVIKKLKIFTFGMFMLGLPGDSRDTCRDTIRFAKEVDCDIVKFGLAVPYPGSQLYKNLSENKNLIFDFDKFNSLYNWVGEKGDPIYVPEGMDGKELTYLQWLAHVEFYVRPRIILRYLLRRIVNPWRLFFGGYVVIRKYLFYLFQNFLSKSKIRKRISK